MDKDFLCLDEVFDQSLTLMDGGLGTTLEDELGSMVSQSPLWSAYPIGHNPEAVVQAHLKIISTATYQCSFDTLTRAGYDEGESKLHMLKCVRLANEARARFQAQSCNMAGHTTQRRSTFVALSLGPFGATLQPTQEFHGYYPPPYGPREFTAGAVNENAFEHPEDEIRAIDALAHFHFDRLLSIHFIAFETVPLRREVKAIRKAMGWLRHKFIEEGRKQVLKPWWISCIDQLFDAAYQPSAFGINCTALKYIPSLVAKVSSYFEASETNEAGPFWLVLYPNGTGTYDEENQRWNAAEDDIGVEWAKELIRVIEREPVSRRLLVGGCCHTGPKEISTLHRYLETIEHNSFTLLEQQPHKNDNAE
ncbi:Homocysteine S-methyltransferase [Pholiota molesta]|nr:Homocysteine S-methyltransferase [Pholiota molesta]